MGVDYDINMAGTRVFFATWKSFFKRDTIIFI